MSVSLPAAIAAYFEAAHRTDTALLTQCFAPDAVVQDEGRMHRGHDAIAAWKMAARQKFDYTVEPIGVSADGDRVIVAANVVGNFPGSPVQLDHVFRLASDQIASLEIR